MVRWLGRICPEPPFATLYDLQRAISPSDGWQPSGDVPIRPELGGAAVGGRDVVLRFTSGGV